MVYDMLLGLAIALVSYYIHDTIQLFIASLLKHRRNGKLNGFPVDTISYFNLQRIGLTFLVGYGWSSEFNFLYNNSNDFKQGRLGVFLVHALSPILYLAIGMFWFYLGEKTVFLSFLSHYSMRIGLFNFKMATLMMMPIPPLELGMALFSGYSKVGYEIKRKQLEFYGNLFLVVIVIMSILFQENILPFDWIQTFFLDIWLNVLNKNS